jgi:hypothetical protein
MKTPLLLLTLALLAGCNTGRIKTPNGVTLYSPKDASAPSSVKEGQKAFRTTIPAGTVVVRESVAATLESPAIERETTSYTQPAERVETETKTDISVAAPRTPDQAVALHKADLAERRILLFAAIGALGVAAVLAYARQRDLAIVAGSIAAALFALWYAPWLSIVAIGLVVAGLAWWMYSQWREKSKTTEALRRTIQTVEELKIDQPAMAKEIVEYQSANLDTEHKSLIQSLQPSIDKKYVLESIAKRYQQLS